MPHYQPIGGVYKAYDSFRYIADKLEVKDEREENFRVKNDLRVYVESKNSTKFLKWFQTKLNREVNVTREFFEEIMDKGILRVDDIQKIEFEFIKDYNSGLHYSTQFQAFEILLHDIYEVRLGEELEQKIKEYIKDDSTHYLILAEQDDIEKKTYIIDGQSYNIGEQTINII